MNEWPVFTHGQCTAGTPVAKTSPIQRVAITARERWQQMSETRTNISPAPGAATGGVRTLLRCEALAVLIVATGAYFSGGGDPWLYVLAFFAPDLSFAGYGLGARIGAAAYNSAHSYVTAALLGGAGWLIGMEIAWQLALILAAHIGFDRSLGYGLKYRSAFGDTHLGQIGRGA